ncbi:fumarylacetoacetate hydrolase family protein [Pendulispora rubella]|uniref:Fumarylacetoacetate hydrolase family protein n=1 Tax=Pendulispora rubella TaxID=2741070 RepID=A0ABZ2L101_9BACT
MRIVRIIPPSAAPAAPLLALPVFAILDGSTLRLLSKAPWEGGTPTGETVPHTDALPLLAPVVPSKIVCVGRNYAAHAKELGNEVPKAPLLFFKPPSALIGHGGTIVLPPESERVEHEAEVGIVIGRRCKGISREQAREHIFGVTCVGDITARDLQRADGQWARAKGFDSFCPAGPWIETDLDAKLADLRISCTVNGATRQDGRTSQMIFPIDELLAYTSRMMTLEPGDLLVTGTPEGVGPLVHGDRLEISVEGVGTLACAVRK